MNLIHAHPTFPLSFSTAAALLLLALSISIPTSTALANDAQDQVDELDSLVEEGEEAEGGAAGSNPLASISKIDLSYTFTKPGSDNVSDVAVKGAAMVHPRIKFNYELHYAVTDVTGSTRSDWSSLHFKPIFFVKDVPISEKWGMRVATGFEWILDFNNRDQGIGTDSDLIAPLLGFAFLNRATGLALIPLVQHFESYENDNVSQTAFRLIGLLPLRNKFWAKLDAKIPYDWENERWLINSEFEVGRMLTQNIGFFGQVLVGIGDDRPFDWGATAALRFNF